MRISQVAGLVPSLMGRQNQSGSTTMSTFGIRGAGVAASFYGPLKVL